MDKIKEYIQDKLNITEEEAEALMNGYASKHKGDIDHERIVNCVQVTANNILSQICMGVDGLNFKNDVLNGSVSKQKDSIHLFGGNAADECLYGNKSKDVKAWSHAIYSVAQNAARDRLFGNGIEGYKKIIPDFLFAGRSATNISNTFDLRNDTIEFLIDADEPDFFKECMANYHYDTSRGELINYGCSEELINKIFAYEQKISKNEKAVKDDDYAQHFQTEHEYEKRIKYYDDMQAIYNSNLKENIKSQIAQIYAETKTPLYRECIKDICLEDYECKDELMESLLNANITDETNPYDVASDIAYSIEERELKKQYNKLCRELNGAIKADKIDEAVKTLQKSELDFCVDKNKVLLNPRSGMAYARFVEVSDKLCDKIKQINEISRGKMAGILDNSLDFKTTPVATDATLWRCKKPGTQYYITRQKQDETQMFYFEEDKKNNVLKYGGFYDYIEPNFGIDRKITTLEVHRAVRIIDPKSGSGGPYTFNDPTAKKRPTEEFKHFYSFKTQIKDIHEISSEVKDDKTTFMIDGKPILIENNEILKAWDMDEERFLINVANNKDEIAFIFGFNRAYESLNELQDGIKDARHSIEECHISKETLSERMANNKNEIKTEDFAEAR